MSVRQNIWIEKYRPETLDELALSDSHKKLLSTYVEEQEIPNLLLSGPSGIGKTTLAQILTNSIDSRVLILNASKERGIDTIREQVGTFAKSRMLTRWNHVVLDEADALTNDAQTALRNLMETYSDQTRFILTANYPNKIIDPIKSRCVEIKLSDLGVKDRALALVRILRKEAVPIVKDVVISYATSHIDLRRMINAAQRSVASYGELRSTTSTSEVSGEDVWNLISRKDWKGLVAVSKMDSTDHTELLRMLFWAIPDNPSRIDPNRGSVGVSAANLRAIVEEKLSTSTYAPDPVVHFLGTCASLIKEV